MPSSSSASFTCDGIEWRKVRILGKGSFGEAHLIETVVPPHNQAVCKLVHVEAMKPDQRKEALNEVRVLSQLRHPNIVAYLGSFEANGFLHILMEYCNAGDVDQYIKKRKGSPIPENTIATIFVQVVQALRYLHERRILHRDLKAQNVFLSLSPTDSATEEPSSSRLVAKLGDFGISTVLRNTLAMAKTVCGTPYYFSPELCLNRPYNNKSDIWSLGCILYEMATLKHAFDAANMKALMQRILLGQYAPLPAQYHRSMQDLVDRMLEQKVEKRFHIQAVQQSAFVQQHSERLLQQHELESSDKRRRLKQQQQQQQPVPTVAITSTAAAVRRPKKSTADDRVKMNRNRRDQEELERKQALVSERRRKDFRAAQNYDRHRARIQEKMAELQRLDDVRRRIEICSYEDQQKFVEEGWRVVAGVREKQQERAQQHEARDQHLNELMLQMQAIEEKMQSRRVRRDAAERPPVANPSALDVLPNAMREPQRDAGPRQPVRVPTARELAQAYKNRVSVEAPWNRQREVPVGFTKESWEAHCNVMGYAVALPTGAKHSPRGIAPQHPQSQAPDECKPFLPPPGFRPPGSLQPPMHDPRATEGPDSIPPARGQLSDHDMSCLLNAERQRLASDPSYQEVMRRNAEREKKENAICEWEEHKRRIREAQSGASVEKSVARDCSPQPPDHSPALCSPEPARAKESNPTGRVSPRSSNAAPLLSRETPGFHQPNGNRFREDAPVPRQRQVPRDAYAPSSQSSSSGSDRSSTDEDETDGEDVEYDDYEVVMNAMKVPSTVEPPHLFEEDALPVNDVSRVANAMKFTLDGRTLHLDGVSEGDPPHLRARALRQFLCDALGGERQFAQLRTSLAQIQSAAVEESIADAMLEDLERQYGRKASLVDLCIQLIVCEAML